MPNTPLPAPLKIHMIMVHWYIYMVDSNLQEAMKGLIVSANAL